MSRSVYSTTPARDSGGDRSYFGDVAPVVMVRVHQPPRPTSSLRMRAVCEPPRRLLALDLLAQDFELEPILFRSGQLVLGGGERIGDFRECGAVAGVEAGIVEPVLQRADAALQLGDPFRQCL